MSSGETAIVDGIPADLPPELNVLMGVFLLYWKIDEVMDTINVSPALTKNERQVLVNLPAPRRMGELAGEMQILPSALTAIADGMEEKGLIARERDPHDRRAWQLVLTQEGIAKRQALISRAVEIFSEVSGLTSDETETIASLMQKVTRNIKAKGLPEGAKSCQ
jgi:DNA-binding MarR family transcriptional regulator